MPLSSSLGVEVVEVAEAGAEVAAMTGVKVVEQVEGDGAAGRLEVADDLLEQRRGCAEIDQEVRGVVLTLDAIGHNPVSDSRGEVTAGEYPESSCREGP